jgi:predicted nucleic acid-binding protein
MFLLDTNVVSELRKIRSGKGDRNVAAWADSIDTADLFVSVVTILELEIGILRVERRDSASGAVLRDWMNERVLTAFANRMLAVDTAVAKRSAQLHIPDPRPIPDALIAGTALVHGMAVVTRNVADFAPMGVAVVNPWD